MKLNFAENLRKLRRERGFTQEQLAEKMGVSFQTVSRWETGVVYPDIELLPAIAELFDSRVDELLGCTKEDKDRNLNKRWVEYEKLSDPEEQYAFLKVMKRDFPRVYMVPFQMLRIMHVDKIHVAVKPSCVYVDDEYIYFSEFHDGNKYVADPTHTYTTPSGEENHAFTVVYKLASDGTFNNIDPQYFISVKDKVQGFIKDGDVYALSTSYGLSSSHLTFYKEAKDSGKTVAVGEKEIPLYYLDSSNMTKDVAMPAFSEDMDIVNGRVIVSFESACNKYIVGKFFFANKVISYPMEIEE